MALHSAGAVREKKQTMAELKLRRLTELNIRLREDLDRPRVKVSEACQSMINYTKNTKDFMVPSTWGQVDKKDDPYAPQQKTGCCVIS
ncbi:GGL domain-containing protein [Kalaharituber pfeilii]|nr:GGL domain-containing protein [Kalaharituber pfeilii]